MRYYCSDKVWSQWASFQGSCMPCAGQPAAYTSLCTAAEAAGSHRSRLVSALTTLLCIIIPMLRILFNVFPFTPNRWFGLGFLFYYLICTPLLYRVSLHAAAAAATAAAAAAAVISAVPGRVCTCRHVVCL